MPSRILLAHLPGREPSNVRILGEAQWPPGGPPVSGRCAVLLRVRGPREAQYLLRLLDGRPTARVMPTKHRLAMLRHAGLL